MDLRDHFVEFRLGDIYLPDPLTVVYELHGNDLLRGQVVGMSDSGEQSDAFVVVEIEGVRHRVVVPIDRVTLQDAKNI